MKLRSGLLALLLASCNVCEKEEIILDISSKTLATVLECANAAPIRSDLKGAFDKLDLCGKKLNIDTICSTASGVLVRHLKNRIPKAWECTADKSGAVLKQAIERACLGRLGFCQWKPGE